MSLAPGASVGPYEIQSPLGAGGMGEVYRARDGKLNREVALKLLPEAFALDPDRLARFKREAQVLASLNHPNIAAIYGLEDTAGVRALVLELVEGPTLADRIAAGALPLDEALAIARQIIDALEAAHEQGVIHRDLKPANIKTRPDGTVKVLDFGLAKALDPDANLSGVGITQSPTLTTPAMTMLGTLLGTAAYMAPEQARGKAVDKRADIWAFGVVLYEMLTGQRLYEGEGVTETLGAVIHKEPAFAALPADTPAAIRELLRRCLTKDPRKRLRDIGDARIALEEAVAAPAAVTPAIAGRRASRGERIALLAVTVALLAALPVVVLHLRETPPVSPVVRFAIAPPDGAVFSGGNAYAPAQTVSPDGRLIVFRAERAGGGALLWVRPLDAVAPRALPGTDNGDFPFWSPDSRFIAFFAGGKLKKIDASGGPVQTLCDAPTGEGGTWSRDGVIVFAATASAGLSRVPAAGGQAAPATTLDLSKKEVSHRWPQFLPDGRRFLFRAQPGDRVALGSLDSSEITPLLSADSRALYASGSLLFVRQGTLMAQPFDVSRAEPSGEAVPVAENVRYNPTNGRAAFSVSENGVLAYRTSEDARGTPIWVDRNGHELMPLVTTPLDNAEFPRLSPEGRRLALVVAGNVWVYDLEGRPPIKLTFDGEHYAPLWSLDGKRIVYETTNLVPLRSVAADGSGAAPEDVSPAGHFHPHGWTPDGRGLIVARIDGPVTSPDILSIPVGEKGEPQALVQTPAAEGVAGVALSPSGRFLAYAGGATGSQEIWVRPYPGQGAPVRVSPAGGVEPVWSRNGRELYYLEGNKLMSVAVETHAGFNFKPPALLFESGYVRSGQPPSYDVATDGRFLMIKAAVQTTTTPISVVLNWAPR